MSLAAVVLFPSLRFYNMIAPSAFGLPWVVSMNPVSIWKYYSAYQTGRTEAKRDVAANVLAIEESGLPGPGLAHYVRILRERHQIEVRRVAGCVVDEKIEGHQAGYNEVSEREIDRRVGLGRIEEAREEADRVGAEIYAREEQLRKDLTKRVSSIPPNAKVITELISPYLDNQPLEDAAAEQELAQFVKAVEKIVVDAVRDDTPSFKLRVLAKLAPEVRPSFEMSGSLNSPESVWEAISKNLDAMPAPEWTNGSLSVAFDFLVRPPG